MGQYKAELLRWKCRTQQEYIDIYGGVILQKMIYEPLFELEKTGDVYKRQLYGRSVPRV